MIMETFQICTRNMGGIVSAVHAQTSKDRHVKRCQKRSHNLEHTMHKGRSSKNAYVKLTLKRTARQARSLQVLMLTTPLLPSVLSHLVQGPLRIADGKQNAVLAMVSSFGDHL